MDANIAPEARDVFIETLANQLSEAAYHVALQHGIKGSWIDLKLNLWTVLSEALRRGARVPDRPLTDSEPRRERWLSEPEQANPKAERLAKAVRLL